LLFTLDITLFTPGLSPFFPRRAVVDSAAADG
jgi:hypothetical protein